MRAFKRGEAQRLGRAACPTCGYMVDAATKLTGGENKPPVDGDWAVCLACASVNVYVNDGNGLRPPTVEERAEATRDETVQGAVLACIEARDRSVQWPKGTRRR